jgi:hypothetical protein
MARAHDRVLDAVVQSDSQPAWKEMDHHFTLNERIARRIARHSESPVPGGPLTGAGTAAGRTQPARR